MKPIVPDTDWQPVIDAIGQADSILLTTHCNPDGDGIGSQLALYEALLALGKKPVMHNRDGIPRIYRFLEHAGQVQQGDWPAMEDAPELIISLDCGSFNRLAMPEAYLQGRTLVNIDHHASNKSFGNVNVIEHRYCATGAMVFDLLLAMDVTITATIASAIYTAVLTDTSRFRLANATADVYRMAADLIDAGAEPWPISVAVYESHSLGGLNILKLCLDTLEINDDGRSAWIYVNQEMYEQAGANVEDTEGLIDHVRSIENVEVAVLIRSHEAGDDRWKVNFRAKTFADVGSLASQLGGGGHKHAAGCVMRGDFTEVRSKVRQAVSQLLG